MASYRFCFVLGCCLLLPALSRLAMAQERRVSDLLPESTTIYIEAVGTQHWLDAPILQALKQTQVYDEIWRSPDVMKLRGGITLAELMLGERVTSVLGRATADGVVVVGDASTRGVALIGDCHTKQACEELYQRLLKLAENDSKNPLQNSGFKQVDYRGLAAYEVNQAVVVVLDHWLVIGNKAELLRSIADHYLDSPARSLSTNASFVEYQQRLGFNTRELGGNSDTPAKTQPQALAWAWLNVEQLKAVGAGDKFFKGPRNNFLAQLLIGGVIATLRDAPSLAGRLDAQPTGLQLRLVAPRMTKESAREYSYFFGSDGDRAAPHVVKVEGATATLAVHRNLRELWRAAGDLFDQRVNDQLAQADTTLTTLFSGRDFGEEILGALEPDWQLIVASHNEDSHHEESRVGAIKSDTNKEPTNKELTNKELTDKAAAMHGPVPDIKLPAFALVARLQDPERRQPQLKRIFMSLVGFANVVGAMNQQPQLDMDLVTRDNMSMVATRFEVEMDRANDRPVPVQYNFSPTLLMQQEQLVLSSTRRLAESISQQLSEAPLTEPSHSPAKPAAASVCNMLLTIDGGQVAAALASNRDQLVSQNMIEEGHSQAEATKEIDTLIEIVKLIRSLRTELLLGEQAELKVQLDVGAAQ